ncbi:MAG TPA: hypothetical protein VG714_08070 [Acidobacteriaceae bacterium]|nr:hypothetical protein [Acidobacteriaceae bacterium]
MNLSLQGSAAEAIPVRGASGEVRGTQSFVHTLSWCWKRPKLTGLEILWRWSYGIPAGALVIWEALRIWNGAHVDTAALGKMTFLDPLSSAETLGKTANVLWPPVLHVAEWLGPLLVVAWVIVSSLGRTVVMKRLDASMRARPMTLMVLQALRMIALGASFAAWFACLRMASAVAVSRPIAEGREPSVVLLCSIAIVATLGMFSLWAIVSWVFGVAPLMAMLKELGPFAALRASLHLEDLKAKLVEINLVMGIVKISLVVLTMVFSACPLPFEAIATPTFMQYWYVIGAVLYILASDFFHVVRLVAYAELWRVYEV